VPEIDDPQSKSRAEKIRVDHTNQWEINCIQQMSALEPSWGKDIFLLGHMHRLVPDAVPAGYLLPLNLNILEFGVIL